ncbi:unnamed protein product, partial [Rotaria magnacalcarata]
MDVMNPLTYDAEEDQLRERTKYSEMDKLLLPVEFQQQPVSTGTTIVAVEYDGGVVIGADTRTSSGSFVMNRFTDKLTKITDRIFCLRSGSAADTQTIAQIVTYQLDFLSAEANEPPLVRTAANCVRRLIYEYRDDFVAGMIVAGWDKKLGGQIIIHLFCLDRGFEITFRSSDDSSLQIVKYGEYIYDNIILFAPGTKEFGGRLDAEVLTEFIDAGGNILIAGSNTIGDAIREFAGECGIEFADDKNAVIDHLNYDANDDGQHTLIVASPDNLLTSELITGQAKRAGLPFLFRGIGMSSDPENPLLLDVLTGSSSSYTANPDEKSLAEYPITVGKRTLLISVLQARNNARVGFVGSLDFFSNDFFDSAVRSNDGKKSDKSGNEELAVSLTDWIFKQR